MSQSAVPDLDLRAVTKEFGGHRAVDAVSFAVPAGSFFSILGPSGCGKTTLMRMIAGFEQPSSGDIQIRGQSMVGVPANRRPVNMVFQNLALFPTMSVGDNIAYGLHCRGEAKAEIAPKVARILDRVGLGGFQDRRVQSLSGGQRQRVAIARCLVLEPTLLLLDEPLGALDLKLREQMKVELKHIQSAFNTTFVYITHDQSEALVMSDRIAVMNAGRFEQIGTPQDLYHSPATAFVAGFVGASNRFAGTVTAATGGRVELRLANGMVWRGVSSAATPASGAAVQVFIRPEAIALVPVQAASGGDAENRLSGRVRDVLFDGAASTVLVTLDSGIDLEALLPQAGPMMAVKPGDAVGLAFAAAAVKVFPA